MTQQILIYYQLQSTVSIVFFAASLDLLLGFYEAVKRRCGFAVAQLSHQPIATFSYFCAGF